ncbi:XTP/dITP diphosphatase [Lachnotalea sp. AF33-28]|uniref:XTP/dITP diphosphatase n=1 Tax=Lachnotalea sp. AF33-28 TaxID=2292046 RepID=UPI000E484BED|nr:XTP/dITP diphosphatase [Lachnotalea sp. AF33-28]RHP32472.1 XTP/dITP diphosphatase [Lachnotalea sp. AF33-28]
MKDKIIFATSNEGKMKEIRMILADLNRGVLSLKEAGIQADIVEDGKTFEENALIKARIVHKLTGALVLADDSGLEVDYLGGEPGVYSARYMGEDTSYDIKNRSIIDRLDQAVGTQRSARFVCAIAAVFPDGEEAVTLGTIEGEIAREPKGDGGFGYDPIFFVPEFGATTAQLTPKQKNQVSHRAKALKEMKEVIRIKLS